MIRQCPLFSLIATLAVAVTCRDVSAATPVAEWTFDEPAGTPLTGLANATGGPTFVSDGRGIAATGDGALRVRRPLSGGALYYAPLETDHDKPVWLVAEIRGWNLTGPAEEAVRFGLSERRESPGGLADIRLERTGEGEVSIQGIGHAGGTSVAQRPRFANPREEPLTLALHYDPTGHYYEVYIRDNGREWERLGIGATQHERRARFLRLNFVNRFNDSESEFLDIERILITNTPPLAVERDPAAPPFVSARAWAIGDARTGAILGEHNGGALSKSASITKAMCALVVIRLAEEDPSILDETIVFSERAAAARGSHTGLKAGEALTVRDALYGLMLPSGNDAGNAIAEHFRDRFDPPAEPVSSNWPERLSFVAEMNRVAAELGMNDTVYRIPFGDGGTAEDHTTTPRDLLLLAREAFAYPRFRDVVGTKTYTADVILPDGGAREITWTNTNQLLGREGFDGIKTGTTRNAGACLLSTGHRGGDRIFLALLGSSYRDRRYIDSEALYDWAWERLAAGNGASSSRTISIATDFEGASVGSWEQVGDDTIEFTILADNDGTSNHQRWYSFRINGAEGNETTFRITNAHETNASGAWRFNAPAVSHDGGETWGRITETRYEGGVFEFAYTPKSDSDWIALVPVYNFSRWLELIDEIASDPRVPEIEIIAESLEGNPVHLVTVADAGIPQPEKQSIWVVGRQHPGETPSSWMIEGLIRWLLSDDPQAAALLEECSFHIAGLTNPDGVLRGNFRTNTAGLNLNRQWLDPDPRAPTIAATIERILRHREEHDDILLFSDKHAHSSIREAFFYYNSAEATSPEMYEEMLEFKRAFNAINPDFNPSGGRDGGIAGTTAKAWGYRELGVHSVTFEAPYQDITYGPNAGRHMTVEQYKQLGVDFGRAVASFFFSVSAGNP